MLLKGDIKDCNGISIHPLDPSDISFKNVEILMPVTLSELLISMWKNRTITLYSNEKNRIPKHIGLAIIDQIKRVHNYSE